MNNRITAGRIQLIFTFLVIVLVALFVCSLTISLLSITWLQWMCGILTGVVLYFFMYGGYFYFEIAKQDDHFEVKFYNIFPFSREFKMYRVPVSAFVRYEIAGNFLYRTKLFLFQLSASQMAKYPPIFITAFSVKDRVALEEFFKKIKNR